MSIGFLKYIKKIFYRKNCREIQKNDKYILTYNTMCSIVLCVRGGHMDVQLKRGLLDVCVLAAISREDSYGYKIVRDVKPFVDISESTLYPILKRLETAGALETYSVEHNSRLRRFYHITDAGRRRITEFLEAWPEIMTIYEFINREVTNHDET